MTGILLDTNVVSELVRSKPDQHVTLWMARTDPESLYLSAVSLGKLVRGVTRLAAGARRDALRQWIETDLARAFDARILPYDRDAAAIWGRLMGEADRRGRPRAAADAQIAATALRFELALATRNHRDFMGLGLTIVDPWS